MLSPSKKKKHWVIQDMLEDVLLTAILTIFYARYLRTLSVDFSQQDVSYMIVRRE